jgi:hypothetical protein
MCAIPAAAADPVAPAPASATTTSTQVTAPAGNPVVVVSTTAPAPAPAPASAPAPAAEPAAPVQPAAAPAVPPRIAVELHPQPVTPPSREQIEHNRRMAGLLRAHNLRVGGWATLGSTYVLSAIVGAIAIDVARQERIRNYGYWMMVPVAGPFAAAFHTRSATGALFTTMLGVGQAAGLGMALVGGARHRRLKRELTFTAMPTRDGGHVGMMMRF